MTNFIELRDEEIGYPLLRLTLGVNLFLHGAARLLCNRAIFEAYLGKQMQGSPLPDVQVHAMSVVLPWCEGAIGFLILIGFWTTPTLVGGSCLLLKLQVGSCLAQKWDMAGF